MKITCIHNDGTSQSKFGLEHIELQGTELRMLSEQIPALNFRLRTSSNNYSSDWHVAGDPTLLIVLNGTLRIELRSGSSQDFSKGEMFIARDYLTKGTAFDDQLHGHRASILGDEEFSALHLKLARQES